MNQSPWLFHSEALLELRRAAGWYEDRAIGVGEDFVALIERRLEAAARHSQPGTPVPYLKRVDIRWLLLTPRFPHAIVLLLDPRTVIAIVHMHRKPAYWRKRLSSGSSRRG